MAQPAYEMQAQPRGDRWGFVFTVSVGRDSWSSAWIDGGATSAEAKAEGRRQFSAFKASLP